MGINIGSAFAKGIGIVGQNILDKQNKDRERRKNFEMYLAQLDASGQDAESVMQRHKDTLASSKEIAEIKAKNTLLSKVATNALKPSIKLPSYVHGENTQDATTKILTGQTSDDRIEEKWTAWSDHFRPMLTRFEKNKEGVNQFGKYLDANPDQKNMFIQLANDKYFKSVNLAKKNSDGKSVYIPLNGVFTDSIVRNYMRKHIDEQLQNQQPNAFVSNKSKITDTTGIDAQFTVAAQGFPKITPKKYENIIYSAIGNPKVQQLINEYNGDEDTYQSTVEAVSNFIPELKDKTFAEKAKVVELIQLNSQRDKVVDVNTNAINYVGRPKFVKNAINNKIIVASDNVITSTTNISTSLSKGAFAYSTSVALAQKTAGIAGVIQEGGEFIGNVFDALSNNPSEPIKNDLGSGLSDKLFKVIDRSYTTTSPDGTTQTRQIDEASREKIKSLINREQDELKNIQNQYAGAVKDKDTKLQQQLEETYNLHMNKVLLVFSYARLLQAGDPRISNQDFVFVSEALFPNIGLTVEGQRRALINGMARLHAVASEAKIGANFDSMYAIVRPGQDNRLNYAEGSSFVTARKNFEIGDRKSLAENNPIAYIKKYMGVTLKDKKGGKLQEEESVSSEVIKSNVSKIGSNNKDTTQLNTNNTSTQPGALSDQFNQESNEVKNKGLINF